VLYFSCTLQKNVVRGALHLDLIHVSGRLPHTVSDQFKCVTILLDKCGTKTFSTSVLLEAIDLVLKQFCHSYLAGSIPTVEINEFTRVCIAYMWLVSYSYGLE
jgi:hypothetical protein